MLVLGICGSSAPSHRTRALIELALESARGEGSEIQTSLLDLSTVRLEFADGRAADAYSDATQSALALVDRADAFVIGSPMYRGSMTGALKNLIDLIPKEAMVGKAAGLIATGASDHHYLGLDLGLRTAMAFFQVHVVPAILYGGRFSMEDGRIADEKVAAQARGLGADVVKLGRATRGIALGPAIF